jgi:hypothetical protein
MPVVKQGQLLYKKDGLVSTTWKPTQFVLRCGMASLLASLEEPFAAADDKDDPAAAGASSSSK